MLSKRLLDLTAADFDALIGLPESPYLDFKSAAVGGADKDRREFLADVSAFANASGGDIVFGITEQDGIASAAPGIVLQDADKERLRLGDLIRSGLEPRLTHFDIVWVPLTSNAGHLIVRVPRSWAAPHRVTLQGHDKYYIRNSAGKHPMNTDELRRAFTLAGMLVERISDFRAERVALLVNDEGPFPLQAGGSKLVLHIVPLVAFADPPNLLVGPNDTSNLQPFGASGWDYRYTLEGFATHAGPRDGSGFVRAYTLAFRSGIIEAVALLGGESEPIDLGQIERYILQSWPRYLAFLQGHEVEAPLYVLISILRVRGKMVLVPQDSLDFSPAPFRRDNLLLSPFEISAETIQREAHTLFRPLFDNVANAFGLPRSFNYRSNGLYAPRH